MKEAEDHPMIKKQATRIALLLTFLLAAGLAGAQDRIKTYPGYEQYTKISGLMRDAVKPGTLRAT